MSSSSTPLDQDTVKIDYSVTYFVAVVVTGEKPTNRYFLSPLVATYEQARDLLTPLIDQYPRSYIGQDKNYYNSENDRDRQEVLARIVSNDAAKTKNSDVKNPEL